MERKDGIDLVMASFSHNKEVALCNLDPSPRQHIVQIVVRVHAKIVHNMETVHGISQHGEGPWQDGLWRGEGPHQSYSQRGKVHVKVVHDKIIRRRKVHSHISSPWPNHSRPLQLESKAMSFKVFRLVTQTHHDLYKIPHISQVKCKFHRVYKNSALFSPKLLSLEIQGRYQITHLSITIRLLLRVEKLNRLPTK